jgi:hypothetical protein
MGVAGLWGWWAGRVGGAGGWAGGQGWWVELVGVNDGCGWFV